jgi:hypothetical protein
MTPAMQYSPAFLAEAYKSGLDHFGNLFRHLL